MKIRSVLFGPHGRVEEWNLTKQGGAGRLARRGHVHASIQGAMVVERRALFRLAFCLVGVPCTSTPTPCSKLAASVANAVQSPSARCRAQLD